MGSKQLKTVMPGVTVRLGKRGKSLRFHCMVNGVRYTKTCSLPAEIMLNDNGTPTRELRSEYGKWMSECSAKSGVKGQSGPRVPSCRELIETYADIAWKRQGDPRFKKADRTIETAIRNFGYCLEASGLRDNRPYTDLINYDMVRKMADYFVRDREHGGKGLSSLSAWSYISGLQSVTAKWTIVEYRDRGFLVEPQTFPKQSLFGISADPKQYEELPRETVRQIWDWYLKIQEVGRDGGSGAPEPLPKDELTRTGWIEAKSSYAVYAACMLELAMRPKDIGLLTAENFPLAPNGHHRLVYRPTKTRESSNRRADIEIPDALYERLRELKPEAFGVRGAEAANQDGEQGDEGAALPRLVPHLRGAESAVNESLRKIPGLANKQKASYELRKLAIHTILVTPVEQGGGVDQAVRLSGDRRETIEKYYCDPYKSHIALPEAPLKAFLER